MATLSPSKRRTLAASASVLLLLGCSPARTDAPPEKTTAPFPAYTRPATLPVVAANQPLFARLGGQAVVARVVDDFVALVAADPTFNGPGRRRPWTGPPEQVALLKKRFVEFTSNATGGDLPYNGPDLMTASRGMEITDAEFDALAAHASAALEKHKVPARERAELLAVIGRTRSAVVATAATRSNAAPAAPTPPAAAPEKPAPPFVPQPITSDESELELPPLQSGQ